MQNPKPAGKTSGRKTILAVDDSFINRSILSKVFSVKYNIREAEDGIKALEILNSEKNILVVLLDLNMPLLDGFGVLAEMKKKKALREIPVIMIADENEAQNQIKALDAGASDVITKPFNAEIMQHRVASIIERNEAVCQSRKLMLKNEQLYLTTHDSLSGIYNRLAFTEKAAKTISEHPANSYVISCIDIDRFNVINDRFGHEKGDRLLKFLGRRIYREASTVGGIACRDMADIFLFLLPNSQGIMENITKNILGAIHEYGLSMEISAHIGRYLVDDPELDVNLMIDRAILAMRSIKGSDVTRVAWFDEKMHNQLLRRQKLIDEMKPALKAGQFVPFFQPQYNYSDGSISGAEVLVRWKHPENGFISPCEFIPIFEENGFICRLDEYMWEQACKHLRKWLDMGLALPSLSVNISRRDMRSINVAEVIPQIVAKYGLDPRMLHLEITESAYVDNPRQLISSITLLQEKGFTVEMDDFGSGYSSLNTLKDVPVDVLKLDLKFMDNADADSRGGKILASVVQMAKSIGLSVIAEGVETKRQADYLESIGCNLIQGYFFAKPMPADDFEALLLSQPK